jgi:hypothetical protein
MRNQWTLMMTEKCFGEGGTWTFQTLVKCELGVTTMQDEVAVEEEDMS